MLWNLLIRDLHIFPNLVDYFLYGLPGHVLFIFGFKKCQNTVFLTFFDFSYFFSEGGKKMNVGTKKTKCYLTERIIQGAKTKIIISKNVKKEKFKLVGAAPVQSQENHQLGKHFSKRYSHFSAPCKSTGNPGVSNMPGLIDVLKCRYRALSTYKED